jgi:cystathionine beta-lyase/cystathionine gamma-synthase
MAADDLRIDTRVIHLAEGQTASASPLVTPIYETTTFLFDSADEVRAYNEGRSDRFLYSRYENPTVVAVERKLAALEGAEAALAFPAGMAAVATTLLALTRAGDEVLCSAAVYGGTLHFLEDVLGRYDVTPRFLDLEQIADPSRVFTPRTRALWFESPINPTLRCVDVRAVADACRSHGVIAIIDNTFASPINQRPIALGADLVMHSATKYLGGHADVTAGVIAGSAARVGAIARTRRLLGTVLDPMPAYALGRSLKTLPVRIARHNANAAAVAAFLDADPRVTAVSYPGLASHPDHAIAARQMTGFGGMVCFDLGGSEARAARFYDHLRVIRRAASLGGVESLCSLPVLTSQWGHTDEQLAKAGVTRGMVRLSLGLEDPRDLIADVDQALAAAR